MGFQQSVNRQPAPAVEGDFASANPRASMLAGEGALVAGDTGLIVGRFGFARNDNGKVDNADPGVGYRIGFVHRDQPALITAWLGGFTMTVQAGVEVTLFVEGDFWVRTTTAAAFGQKIFASTTTGLARTGAAGASIAGFIETAFFVQSICLANELVKMSTRGPN